MRATLLCVLASALCAFASDALVVRSLRRMLEVGGSVARSQTELQLTYTGNGQQEEILSFHVPDDVLTKTSFLEVLQHKGLSARRLLVRPGPQDFSLSTFEIVVPADRLAGENNLTLTVNEAFVHATTPKPKSLPQKSDGQYMLWQGDLLGGWARHRTINEATVRVKTPSPRVKSYQADSRLKASQVSGAAQVVFTSQEKVTGEIFGTVHYEQPTPVITFRRFNRAVEVSHWASNLAFEDQISLVNDGPHLDGQFSRIEYQKQTWMGKASAATAHILSGLALTLPAGARDPYFVDTVGNVSTSHFRPAPSGVVPGTKQRRPATLEIQPRYPIMGGWQYDFTIGYSTPLRSFLRIAKDGRHVLAVPLLLPAHDLAIDDAEVRISLPEGATDVQLLPPFPMSSEATTYQSYLDTTGRPTVILRKRACSDRHAVDVIITYRYSALALLQKPIAVGTVALAIFLSGSLLRRVRWSINAPDSKVVRAL